MLEIRSWAQARPFTMASLILLVVVLWFFVPALTLVDHDVMFGHGRQPQGSADFASGLWIETLTVLVLVVTVIMIGWARETGLSTKPRLLGSLLMLPYLAFAALIAFAPELVAIGEGQEVISLAPGELQEFGLAAIMAFLVGLFEELTFRGVVLHGLRSRMPAIAAVLVTAALFGAFHFVNWVGGQPFDITLAQVLGAAGGGVLYGAMVLVTGSLWPAVIMHGSWDAAITFSQALVGAGNTLPLTAGDTTHPWVALKSPEMIAGLTLLAGWWLWTKLRARRASNTM